MVAPKLVYPPQSEEHVEALTELAREHCIRTTGMKAATVTILWWKELNDD